MTLEFALPKVFIFDFSEFKRVRFNIFWALLEIQLLSDPESNKIFTFTSAQINLLNRLTSAVFYKTKSFSADEWLTFVSSSVSFLSLLLKIAEFCKPLQKSSDMKLSFLPNYHSYHSNILT